MKSTTTAKSTIKPSSTKTSKTTKVTPATITQKKTNTTAPRINTLKAFTVDQRTSMIAEAAYYIAEKANFNPDLSLACWLEAEREIDSKILEN